MVAKRRGRPTKVFKLSDRRASLGLRVTVTAKRRLESAAKKTGRSQSQEAEFRLERSFEHDDIFGGAEIREVAMGMAAAFLHGARLSGKPPAVWAADRDSYQAGALAVWQRLWSGLPNATDGEKAELIEMAYQSTKGRLLGSMTTRGK
jgi:TraY domain